MFSYITSLLSDPKQTLIFFLLAFPGRILAISAHEFAHAWVANRCGDPTARMMGRMTLNPAKHLDLLGTLMMLLLGFGWAKPVPVNPRNFENYRRDDFLVSIAGITVNITLFLLSLSLAVGLNSLVWKPEVIQYYGAKALLSSNGIGYSALLTAGAGQLDDLMRTPWLQYVQRFLLMFSTMNLSVGLFNLLPLHGFHILNDIILKGRLSLNRQWFQITQVILIMVCLSGALSNLLTGAFDVVEDAVLNLFLKIAGLS